MGFPGGSVLRHLPANAGDSRDVGLIPGSGRSPGVRNGNPFQYSCLKTFVDRGAWCAIVCGVAKRQTQMNTQTDTLCIKQTGYKDILYSTGNIPNIFNNQMKLSPLKM